MLKSTNKTCRIGLRFVLLVHVNAKNKTYILRLPSVCQLFGDSRFTPGNGCASNYQMCLLRHFSVFTYNFRANLGQSVTNKLVLKLLTCLLRNYLLRHSKMLRNVENNDANWSKLLIKEDKIYKNNQVFVYSASKAQYWRQTLPLLKHRKSITHVIGWANDSISRTVTKGYCYIYCARPWDL